MSTAIFRKFAPKISSKSSTEGHELIILGDEPGPSASVAAETKSRAVVGLEIACRTMAAGVQSEHGTACG